VALSEEVFKMGSRLQPLEEENYKGDLELLDRYIAFSSELVRMSLLGLAAIGFYLKEFVASGNTPLEIPVAWFNLLLGFAGFLLAIAIACGLLHRYYATDGLAYHLNAHRLSARPDRADEAETEWSAGTGQYKLAHSWLVSCECAVAAGIVVLGVAFSVRFGFFWDVPRWKIALPSALLFVIAAAFVSGKRWAKIFRERWVKSGKHPTPSPDASRKD
jgi:hypothetical protein